MRIRPLLFLALLLAAAPRVGTAAEGAFALDLTGIDGAPLPLEAFAGHPLLVANTASFCGFTPQYEDLQALYDRYRDEGLVVLGVPSDSFNQESDDDATIKQFCEVTFGIDFPLSKRVEVVGPSSDPLFAYFRERLGQRAGPGWNFYKYLIAPDGTVAAFWPSSVRPTSTEVTGAIEKLLPAS